MSTATELRRHLQKAAAEEDLGANAVFRTKWPSDRHPGRFEHLNLGPDVTSGMEATLAVPTTVMGTVTVPRVKIPDYEATRLGWQAARGMAADVAPPLIALAALLGVGGIGGAAYWHHRKNRKRQQDESLRKKQQQEKTAVTKSQELKRRLQKAAAEVAQTQEEEAKKRKGPTFGQKLLRGGLATAAGGMAGLIGGGYGGFKLGQHASNRLQDSALRELRADHQTSRSGLSSLWMPPLSEENLKAIAGAATENDRAELEGTGALGGAALGAGGGALLGLAVYFAFRRAGRLEKVGRTMKQQAFLRGYKEAGAPSYEALKLFLRGEQALFHMTAPTAGRNLVQDLIQTGGGAGKGVAHTPSFLSKLLGGDFAHHGGEIADQIHLTGKRPGMKYGDVGVMSIPSRIGGVLERNSEIPERYIVHPKPQTMPTRYPTAPEAPSMSSAEVRELIANANKGIGMPEYVDSLLRWTASGTPVAKVPGQMVYEPIKARADSRALSQYGAWPLNRRFRVMLRRLLKEYAAKFEATGAWPQGSGEMPGMLQHPVQRSAFVSKPSGASADELRKTFSR